jgi:hypothetical protein
VFVSGKFFKGQFKVFGQGFQPTYKVLLTGKLWPFLPSLDWPENIRGQTLQLICPPHSWKEIFCCERQNSFSSSYQYKGISVFFLLLSKKGMGWIHCGRLWPCVARFYLVMTNTARSDTTCLGFLKRCLHYAENHTKLGGFQICKNIFCSLKRTSLERLSPKC